MTATAAQKYLLVTGGTRGIGRAVAARFVAEGFGVLTCARSAPDLDRLRDEPDGALRRLLEVNVASAYDLTRAVLPPMLVRGEGHFFTICSTASIMAYSAGGSYCISKFALLGFTKVLREELKTSALRVTAILPGATLTDSWAGADLPPDRLMPPEDVAEAVWTAWAASPRTVVEEVLLRPQLGDLP